MDEDGIMEEYKQRLPGLFRQILLMFKDAPTCNSWVLEKLMEVFCKDIAHNMELVKVVDFSSFLNGFLEADSLIMYPDFVMNSVSLMADEVLSAHNNCSFIEAPAFFIIRSPLHYWMVTKGHRVDVTFQIYKKWVQQKSMLHLLDGVQFDVAQAMVHCLASPHNYTRQSAGNYFVELIKFTHDVCPGEAEDEVLCNIKSRLKSRIYQLTQQFNAVFTKYAENVKDRSSDGEKLGQQENSTRFYQKAAVNYCRLLSECTVTSNVWCRSYAETDMFDQLTELLQVIAADNDVDQNDLFRPSTVMLIRLITYSSEMQNLKVEKLIKLLIHVSEIINYSIICDAIYMARLILTQFKTLVQDPMLLVEFSLLPLFVLFDVTPQSVLNVCPNAVTSVKSFLKAEQKSKPSSLLKVTVDNLSSLADVQISKTCYGPFIDYLELKSMDPPSEVGLPMMNGRNIRSDTFLSFLVLMLSQINLALNQSTDDKCPLKIVKTHSLLDNVQAYTKACLNHLGTSCWHLSTIMDCYLTVLKHLNNVEPCENKVLLSRAVETGCAYNRQILQDVLQGLQFKMFDRDPNVREMAVKSVGDLFFIVHQDNSVFETSVDMCASLSSLWQCVDNKTEGVAMKVLEFLTEAAVADKLNVLLSLMNVTEADVVTRVDTFLLSSPWDDIKPVAFNLLTKMCPLDVLVRYAEACLHQDNVRLALVVLDYIQEIFCQEANSLTLKQKVDMVISLLVQGWGDLILQKTSAADVCSLRRASSIMAKILTLLEQPGVCIIIDKRVSDFCLSLGMALDEHYEGSHAQFVKICDEILRIYGHVDTVSEKQAANKHSDVQEHISWDTVNADLHGHCPMITKRKGSHINNDNKGIPVDEIQRFESSTKDKHSLSFVCLVCTLIDAKKISSAKRNRQHTTNSDDSERKQISDSPELHSDSSKEKMVSFDEYDFFIDSTKEMPALTLRTESFASQKQIEEILSHCDKCSHPNCLANATGLLSWLVFREMFRRIDPGSLQQEAQRSTDEYERNSVTVLYDLDQVVRRNFHTLQDQLERQLTEHFFSSFSSFLNTALNTVDSKMRGEVLKEIINNAHIMKLVQHEEENVTKFILQKRRSVLKTPFENNENQFVLDQFQERLNYLSSQGSKGYVQELFASADELKVLLQLYMNENIDGSLGHYSCMKSNTSTEYIKNNTESDQDMVVDVSKIIAILHSVCGEVRKPEVTESLACLEVGDIHFLKCILDGELEDWETTQACVKTLLNSSWQEILQAVLQLLQSMTKQLILVVCDQDNQVRVERCSKIVACFGQLENWFSAKDNEFNSDGDDDPTAIDCF